MNSRLQEGSIYLHITINLSLHMPAAGVMNKERGLSRLWLNQQTTYLECCWASITVPRPVHGLPVSLVKRLLLALVPAAESLQPALASTRLNSWSGGSGAPASTLPRKEQAPLWFGPQKPRDRGCHFATRHCTAWTARKYMPYQEKKQQGAVPRGTSSLYYHDVILVTYRQWQVDMLLVLACVEHPPH